MRRIGVVELWKGLVVTSFRQTHRCHSQVDAAAVVRPPHKLRRSKYNRDDRQILHETSKNILPIIERDNDTVTLRV